MPWDDTFYLGETLDEADFLTLNEIFASSDLLDPDATFAPFSSYTDDVDGGRTGRGFPVVMWKWNAIEDLQVEALRVYCAALSSDVYIRTQTNRVDVYGAPVFATYKAKMLWMPRDEDKQAGKTLGFVIEFRHLILQAEIP